MSLHYKHEYEKLPLRYELLFDGDNRGWRTGIDCVLELSVMDLWSPNCITNEDRKVLKTVLDPTTNCSSEYHWLIDQFIDSARCIHPDLKIPFKLDWIDGSIFAVPVELNQHELVCLYGEYQE